MPLIVRRSYPIVILSGEKGAGKSTVASLLSLRRGYAHVSLGELVRANLRAASEPISAEAEYAEMTRLRQNETGSALPHLRAKIDALLVSGRPICIDSAYDRADVAFFNSRQLSHALIVIEADASIRADRIKARWRPGDRNEIVWRQNDKREDLRNLAGAVLTNNGSLDALFASVLSAVDALEAAT